MAHLFCFRPVSELQTGIQSGLAQAEPITCPTAEACFPVGLFQVVGYAITAHCSQNMVLWILLQVICSVKGIHAIKTRVTKLYGDVKR